MPDLDQEAWTRGRGAGYARRMTTMNVQDAKAHLSDLVARAEKGEDVVIARAGRPAVRLVAVTPRPRRFGTMDLTVPDAFFEPLDENELAAWE